MTLGKAREVSHCKYGYQVLYSLWHGLEQPQGGVDFWQAFWGGGQGLGRGGASK